MRKLEKVAFSHFFDSLCFFLFFFSHEKKRERRWISPFYPINATRSPPCNTSGRSFMRSRLARLVLYSLAMEYSVSPALAKYTVMP